MTLKCSSDGYGYGVEGHIGKLTVEVPGEVSTPRRVLYGKGEGLLLFRNRIMVMPYSMVLRTMIILLEKSL